MKSWYWVIVAVIGTAIVAILLYKGCTAPAVDLPVAKTDTVVRWQAVDSSYWQTLLTQKDQQYSNMEQRYKDSIAKVLRIASSQVSELLTANTKAESIIESLENPEVDYAEPVKDCPPAVKSLSQRFKNKWYTINATIRKDGKPSKVTIQAFDTLKVVRSKVKVGGWFNKKEYQRLDIGFANPYVQVSGVRSFTVPPPKPKRFGIGIFAGYGYGLDSEPKRMPIVGVGGTYNLIRF